MYIWLRAERARQAERAERALLFFLIHCLKAVFMQKKENPFLVILLKISFKKNNGEKAQEYGGRSESRCEKRSSEAIYHNTE